MLTDYFKNLFASNMFGDSSEVIQEVQPIITEDMNRTLTMDISEEITNALFSMHPEKSSGSDDMTTLFYQHFWASIRGDLVILIRNFFRSGVFDNKLNETNISFIPNTE